MAQNVAAASTQLGSWNATGSPGCTPTARSPPATRHARSYPSANVPRHGRVSEWIASVRSRPSTRPAPRIVPRVSSVQDPSATYRRVRSPLTARRSSSSAMRPPPTRRTYPGPGGDLARPGGAEYCSGRAERRSGRAGRRRPDPPGPGRRLRRRGPAPRRRGVRGDAPHRVGRPPGRRHRGDGRAVEPGVLPALPGQGRVAPRGARGRSTPPRRHARAAHGASDSGARDRSRRGSKGSWSRPATPRPRPTPDRSR